MSQEVYNIARVAQAKLSDEASSRDHNLHRLVAHANLYDKLLDACYDSDTDTEAQEVIYSHESQEKGSDRAFAPVPSPGKTDVRSSKEDPPCYETISLEVSGDFATIAVEEVEVSEDDD